MNYIVSAKLNGSVKRVAFEASNDGEAMMVAILEILDRAMKSSVWAKGAIQLRSADGRVIQEMEQK